ncbi:MAG: hypothetical protein AAF928_00390 [Myxococcota bacterium]
MRWWWSCTFAVVAVATPAAAAPGDALAARGRELFAQAVACEESKPEEGDLAPCRASYALAADAFRRAYAESEKPKLLFNQAQSERLNGDCDAAVATYRRYLALEPGDRMRAVVVRQLDKCGADPEPPVPEPPSLPLPARPSAPPAAPSEVVPPTPAPPVVVAPVVRTRWYEDPYGHVLSGLAIAGGAVGGALVGVSYAREAELGGSPPDGDRSYDEHADDVRAAGVRRTAGVVALGAAGACAVGAVLRYVVADGTPRRRDDDGPAAIRLDASWHGFGVAVRTVF